ncbi:MAG: hypothetical protein IKL10_10760 [Clostridia bacterium]|nr:hypothetical protein [Clostridia bacterium]
MKRIAVFFLILCLVFVLAACKDTIGEETTSSDITASETAGSEETSEAVSDTVEIVETNSSEEENSSEISVSATQNIENSTTEAFTVETPSEVTTVKEEPVTVTDDKIIAPAYSLEIPKDFEVKSDGNDPLLENKQGTIQFNIMDKTKIAKDFDSYASDTYKFAKATGIAKSELEDVSIKNIQMKRFAMTTADDDGTPLEAYVYFAKVNSKALMITLTSKDGGLEDVSAADKFVEEIDFMR